MSDDPSLTPGFTSYVLVTAAEELPEQDRAPFLTGASVAFRLAAERRLDIGQLERTASVLLIQAGAAKEKARRKDRRGAPAERRASNNEKD